MSAFLLKRMLPFVLTLLVGAGLVYVLRQRRQQARLRAEAPTVTTTRTVVSTPTPPTRPLPEIHILSTNLVEENIKYTPPNRAWHDLQVLYPPGVLYTKGERKPYRQGVMQVNVLFGADGEISEIEPRRKRVDCSPLCLPATGNVVEIDPTAEQSQEYVAAARAAVKQIKFVPFTSDGQFVPTHGLIECVFRLD